MSVITPVPIDSPSKHETPHLRFWQRITIALLLVGYAGYYLCRSDLSVATPLLIKAFGSQGLDKAALGGIISLGTLAYAFGKFVNGSVADHLGGRKMFLLGMGGAVVATFVFVLGGLPLFTLAWVANRLIQSTGWVGMVKLTGRWFSFSRYGTVMGIISLSFLFGDFFSRILLGELITSGLGWRGVFYVSGGLLAAIFLVTFFFLKESPRDIGEPEPDANPANLFGVAGHDDKQTGLGSLLGPLLRSPVFWVVCALSFGFTLVRETFGTWTPQYLTEVAGMEAGAAGTASSLFPLFGGLSVLACGYASDRLGSSGRAMLILAGLILSVPALLALGYAPTGHSPLVALIILGVVAFVLIGPYSFLAGAVSLDFGGKRGSATAAGWIDGVGYLGGILAGQGVGAIAEHYGWARAFLALAVVTSLSCIAAFMYWRQVRTLGAAGATV